MAKSGDFKVTEHVMVPEHKVLSDEEKEELLEKYNIVPKQLPKIYDSDPVVEELGASVGDVLKIIRDSDTAGKSVYYRLVIEEK